MALYNTEISSTLAGVTSGTVSFNQVYAPLLANTMTGGTFLLTQVGFGSFNFYANTNIVYKLLGESAGNVFQAIRAAADYVVVANQDYYIGVTSTAAPRTITLPKRLLRPQTNHSLSAMRVVPCRNK